MGNNRTGKQSRASKGAQQDGELNGEGQGGGTSGGGGGGERTLTIRLIKLDESVVRRTKINDPVTLRAENGHIEALVAGARLGDVPSTHTSKVRALLHDPAFVSALVQDDPQAAAVRIGG